MKFPHIITGQSKYRFPFGAFGLAIILVFVLALSAGAQNKKQLENKRRKLIRDIELTDKLLKKTTRTKEAEYDRFIALQKQIQQRSRLIETLQAEIQAADSDIMRNTAVTDALAADLNRMREEYGRTLRLALRRKEQNNPLVFLLSADDFNQAFQRWLFLRRYDRLRKEQAEAIIQTQATLQRKILNIEKRRQEKENLLISLQSQQNTLSGELTDKNTLLKNLGRDESRLRNDLEQKEKAREALNTAIETVIQEEVRKSIEAARKPKPTPPVAAVTPPAKKEPDKPAKPTTSKAKPAPTPEIVEDATTNNFRRSRGNMPWPVEKGFISKGFGRQKHPTIRNIEITNNGIDIRTEPSAGVRAVYEGTVAGVQFIPGHDYTVILQHGTYYTVYSNLSETDLSKGQSVKARQNIGKVSNNPITGASELHFELWYQKERLNPQFWIRK